MVSPTWVVGAGGLLGKAMVAQLQSRGVPVLTRKIPWASPGLAGSQLRAAFEDLRLAARRGPWRIAWCAGAGVTGTSAGVLDQEVETLRNFLRGIRDVDVTPGSALFLASSAGALYAGASDPPFTELHPIRSISAYGNAKRATEIAATEFGTRTGAGVLVGRISNLYGPGQNLAKSQGLVSHICRSHLTGQPISIYVSLDTIRDYLFIEDAAAMISDALDELGGSKAGNVIVKILATQQGVTIGALLAECRRLFKRAPKVVLGSSPNAKYQVRDLRMRSVVWPELDDRDLTPLGIGITATAHDLLGGVQRGELSAAG
jgi:UDP-glucose 4-epimerase